ncbi:hypothetical protein IFM89_001233 [Coptis chinensis]|uniref:RNase H type-1 domain-containing protein n=1 Tax=Coptis chinensis TaxID=261450 RepID=A0A835LD18_9MAGN|nr:hypothetical protein IFM89_001233 [Coptis chinensis]
MQMFDSLIAKVEQCITGWKSKLLSQAGRTVLIKSITIVIPTYQMACFSIPKKILQKKDSLQRDFWWGKHNKTDQANHSHGLYLKNWKFICKSKCQGGLGIRDLENSNITMLSKLAWQLITEPSSLWATILKAKYHPHSTAINSTPKQGSSWIWHSTCKGMEHIKSNSIWHIGDGSAVSIWNDHWIPGNPPILNTPHHFVPLLTHVKDLILPNPIEWNIPLLQNLFSACFGIGFILRDSHGSFLAAGTRIGYATLAEDAECRGILMATQWALARQISHLEIETDAQAIATYWENLHSNLAWQSELILQDIRSLSSHFVHFSISFCNRLLNGIADILSHKALLLKDSYQWEGDPPLWLVDAIGIDICSTPTCTRTTSTI